MATITVYHDRPPASRYKIIVSSSYQADKVEPHPYVVLRTRRLRFRSIRGGTSFRVRSGFGWLSGLEELLWVPAAKRKQWILTSTLLFAPEGSAFVPSGTLERPASECGAVLGGLFSCEAG